MPPGQLLGLLVYTCFVISAVPLLGQAQEQETRAKLLQLERLVERTDAAIEAEDWDGAITRLEEIFQLEEAIYGKLHVELLGTLDNLAEVAEIKQDDIAVIGYRERQRSLTQELYGAADYRSQDAERAVAYANQHAKRTPEQKAQLALAKQREADMLQAYRAGDFARAFESAHECLEIRERVLNGPHPMVESLRHQLDSYLSLATREPKDQEAAYAALLRWKGSVWQRQQRQRVLIDQPTLKPRFAELGSVSSRLSALILNPPSEPAKLTAWQRQLGELTEQRERLERELSLASGEYRQTAKPVTVDQLRGSIPPGALLIDFFEYNHHLPADTTRGSKKRIERRLLVHLVRADQAVREIDLGPVQPLNAWVQIWRQDFGQSPASVAAAQALRQRIWEPLAESLEGMTTAYVSPDGLLGQFPLAALPGRDSGAYLVEELAIVMLPVPQGLPAAAGSTRPSEFALNVGSGRFCLVGDVDYDQVASVGPLASAEWPSRRESTPAAETAGSSQQEPATGGDERLPYVALPGTVSEMESIVKLIGEFLPQAETTVLRGPLASKAAFSQAAPHHQYLHIATHGFFAPEKVKNARAGFAVANSLLSGTDSQERKWVGTHPDVLSGLVFAGANRSPQQAFDAQIGSSVLTAAEVQSLDLRGVDLAVLSACETGLGATAGGEGIIGLQRAFQLSGAKTTITSLWQVDDAATEVFMVQFYRNLFEHRLSKIESLRQAQIWLLRNPQAIAGRDMTTRGDERKLKPLGETPPNANPARSLPAFWAAFQLSGDPG